MIDGLTAYVLTISSATMAMRSHAASLASQSREQSLMLGIVLRAFASAAKAIRSHAASLASQSRERPAPSMMWRCVSVPLPGTLEEMVGNMTALSLRRYILGPGKNAQRFPPSGKRKDKRGGAGKRYDKRGEAGKG